MTTYLRIGAIAANDQIACYADHDWGRLLDAWASGDTRRIEAVVLSATPRFFPTSQLRAVVPNPPKTVRDVAGAYWTKYGKAPKARATDASGTPIVATVLK